MAEKKKIKNVKKDKYIWATGRRKESVARIYLCEGSGKIKVNKRAFEKYFPREVRVHFEQPHDNIAYQN